jgi:hypothetical protein
VKLLTFQHTGEALSALEQQHLCFCLQQFSEAPRVQQLIYPTILLHLLFLIQQDFEELSSSHCLGLSMLACHSRDRIEIHKNEKQVLGKIEEI